MLKFTHCFKPSCDLISKQDVSKFASNYLRETIKKKAAKNLS